MEGIKDTTQVDGDETDLGVLSAVLPVRSICTFVVQSAEKMYLSRHQP